MCVVKWKEYGFFNKKLIMFFDYYNIEREYVYRVMDDVKGIIDLLR